MKLKRIINIIVVFYISYVVYSLFKIKLDINNIELLNLLIILLIVNAILIIKAIRWYIIVGINEFKYVSLIYFVGLFFGFTPGRSGELFKAKLLKDKFSLEYKKGILLVVYEKLFDIIGLVFCYSIIFLLNFNLLTVAFLLITIFIICFINFRKFIFSLLLSIFSWLLEIFCFYFFIIKYFSISLEFNYVNAIDFFCKSFLAGILSFMPGGIIGFELASSYLISGFLDIDFNIAFGGMNIFRFLTLWYSVLIGFIFYLFLKNVKKIYSNPSSNG